MEGKITADDLRAAWLQMPQGEDTPPWAFDVFGALWWHLEPGDASSPEEFDWVPTDQEVENLLIRHNLIRNQGPLSTIITQIRRLSGEVNSQIAVDALVSIVEADCLSLVRQQITFRCSKCRQQYAVALSIRGELICPVCKDTPLVEHVKKVCAVCLKASCCHVC